MAGSPSSGETPCALWCLSTRVTARSAVSLCIEFSRIGGNTDGNLTTHAWQIAQVSDSCPDTFRVKAFRWQMGRDHGLIVNANTFESLPVHPMTNVFPMAPETDVVFPLGGLNTSTSTDPGAAMSAAVIAASSCWLLRKLVTRNEPFQLTKESRRKLLPLSVSRNWFPPAGVLFGAIELIKGRGLQSRRISRPAPARS